MQSDGGPPVDQRPAQLIITQRPLSEANLATMREHLTCCWVDPAAERRALRLDVRMLLFEIERLRGEVTLCVELLNLEG